VPPLMPGACKHCQRVMSRTTQDRLESLCPVSALPASADHRIAHARSQCTGGKRDRCRPGMDNKFVAVGARGGAGSLGNAWCCQCARDVHAWHEYDRSGLPADGFNAQDRVVFFDRAYLVACSQSYTLCPSVNKRPKKGLTLSTRLQVRLSALLASRHGPTTRTSPDTCHAAKQKLEFSSGCGQAHI
jgi:hypothetical protein